MLLHLLTETPSPPPGRHLTAGGRTWTLQSHDLSAGPAPPYACVSYAWGPSRAPSPLDRDALVSDRTLPALEALLRHRPLRARVWLDALCVPSSPPRERAATLRSMGFIYARAEEVIVVLSAAARPALEHMANHDRVEESHLAALEAEDWVSRAWTYQEAVNARRLHVACEGGGGGIIDGGDFLNAVGFTLSKMEGSHASKSRRFPRLDTFQDVIADYFVAEYEQRSALVIMTNMDRRTQGNAADHFYAMIGAISAERADEAGAAGDDACEAFMAACERKGDYSFVYAGAPREDDDDGPPARRWRPRSGGELPALLSRHCWGASQPGEEADGRALRLGGMVECRPGGLRDDAERAARKWLAVLEDVPGENAGMSLHDALFRALQPIGFRGSSQAIDTPAGCFFPFEAVPPEKVVRVVVATTVKWVFGGPGMACYERDGRGVTYYTSGVFIGIIDEATAGPITLS
jgi:hypothetical protein